MSPQVPPQDVDAQLVGSVESSRVFSWAAGCSSNSTRPSSESVGPPVIFPYPRQPVDADDFDWSGSSISSLRPAVQKCTPKSPVSLLEPAGSQNCNVPISVLPCLDSPGDPLYAQAVLISEGHFGVIEELDHDTTVEVQPSPAPELVLISPGSTPRSHSPVRSVASTVQLVDESSDEQNGGTELHVCVAIKHMSIVQHKLSDSATSQCAQYTGTPAETPVGFPFEFELPAFVREMLIHLPAGFTDQPRPANDGPLVRIWYIHLDFQARSFQERQLQLTGPPQFWRAQIIATWFDVLAPNQDVVIDLVVPVPPRKWYERSLVFDVILSQSTFARKKPALVTVMPNPIARSLQLYSGAVALDVQITGNQVIQGIAADRLCNDRFCQVTFGHQVVPNEGPANHPVSAGNGFVVHVGRLRSQAAGSADDVVMSTHVPMDIDANQTPDQVPATASHGPADPGSPPTQSLCENAQPSVRASLYALNKPAKHAMVRLHLPQCLLHDVANVFGVQPSQISGLHFVQATPVGEPPFSVHIIVQLLGDLVPGSTEQLLLLDVAFHCHGFRVQPCVQVPVDRRVVIVPQHLVRTRLLDIAFVGTYCELHGHTCLVSLNRQPWKQQDVMISGLSSGGYLRIEVPPPHAQDAHTCHAVELVEDLGLDETQPHFADHYPDLPETSVTRDRSRVTEKTSARHDSAPNVLPEHQLRGLARDAYHIGPYHQPEVPRLQSDSQLPAQHLLPRLQDVSAFELVFAAVFRDYAVTERADEGQVAYIATWYVHHDHHPVCLQGRLIRVPAQQQSWFRELCRPWLAQLRRFETIAIRVVRPSPPALDAGTNIAHVILEQGLYRPRVAALCSVLVQAFHGDSKHQRAQSLPQSVSARDLYHSLDIASLCLVRHCSAWSGVIGFQHTVKDDIFSGIGISVDVRLPRYRFVRRVLPSAGAGEAPDQPPTLQFHRLDDPTTSPLGSSSSLPRAPGEMPRIPDEHVEGHFLPNLRTAWEQYLMTAVTRPFVFQVEVWYCDHDRYPRSDISRVVTLPIDPALWKQRLLQACDDCVDPAIEAFFYVVDPMPIGGAPGLVAHIIVAQNQHQGFVSALITTMVPGDDPWHPHRVVLRLPSVVDHWLLLTESYLLQFCPPFVPANRCNSWWGVVDLTPGNLMPVHSGYGFLCTATPAPVQVADHAIMPADSIDASLTYWHKEAYLLALGLFQCVTHALVRASQSKVYVESLIFEAQELERSALGCPTSIMNHYAGVPPQNVPAFRQSGVAEAHAYVDNESCWFAPLQRIWQTSSHGSLSSRGTLAVRVWYSDHLRHSSHDSAPVVHLTVDSFSWSAQLLAPWVHCLDPAVPVSFFVTPHGALGPWDDVQAHVTLVQNPLPGLASVLLVSHLVGHGYQMPHIAVGLVEVPISPATVANAVRSLHPLYDDPQWRFSTVLDGQPCSDFLIDAVAHGTCFAVWSWQFIDPWIGLSDIQFQGVLQTLISQQSAPLPAKISSSPVTLSLQAALPLKEVAPIDRAFDDKLPTISILEQSNWRQYLSDQELPPLWPLPDGLILPPATYWAMLDDAPLDAGRASWAELYVDGSTNATGAAWSVVVVQTDGIAHRFIGTIFGRVEHESSCPAWIGATTFDNIAAEFTAFAIAMDLACRMGPVVSVIRPDLQLSAHVATQQCVTDSNVQLAKLIAVLHAWLPPGSHVQEVRGHCAHPWNDLADALARWALLHEPPIRHSVPVLHQFAQSPADLQWAWIQGGPQSLFQALPPIVDGQVCQFPLSLRRVTPPKSVGEVAIEPSKCVVQVISLNVLALDPVREQLQHGRHRGHRTARLDEQWHRQKVHIVGLQETRTLPGRDVTEHYMVFSSGFQDPAAPRFGCEAWFHRTLPFVTTPDGTALLATDFKFVVVHADPRRLVIRGDHSCCSFLLFVLHAPCLGKTKGNGHRPIDDISHWWQETSEIIQACPTATFQWVCVDANAPLASQESECFGLLDAETTNPQGGVFEEFLLKHGFAVPSTFPDIHQGQSWTWTHSSGARCRRDYVLVPLPSLTSVQHSFTLTSYDGTFCHDDHIPVGIEFAAFVKAPAASSRFHWDELAFLDPVKVVQFQAALATLPLPTWDVRTTDHCAVFEAQVLQLGQQFFGGHTKKKFRPQLQPATIQLIAFKRHLLDVGRALQLMTNPLFKEELRAVEKVVRSAVYADLAIFYDQLLVRLQNADQAADAKQLYRILDRLGRKRNKNAVRRPLPILRSPDGQLAQTFQQQQQIWLRQFAAVEAGLPISWQALHSLARPGVSRTECEMDPQAFISPWQLLQAMRKLRRGKACGPNAIPPDLLKAGGAPFAMQLSCLTNKVIAHVHEPTSWRGGKLIPLYKGKGLPSDPSSFRSIFVSDFTAKLYHACLRRPLERAWTASLHSMQFGGRAGCGVDLAHHFLQMHQCWARHAKTPAAIVFFDMKAAFYSVLRQACM